jgi:hypothetical protein
VLGLGAVGVDHAFNEFQTTDQGVVYIDDTGVPGGSTLQDKQLSVTIDQPLSGKYLFRSDNLRMMSVNVRSLMISGN